MVGNSFRSINKSHARALQDFNRDIGKAKDHKNIRSPQKAETAVSTGAHRHKNKMKWGGILPPTPFIPKVMGYTGLPPMVFIII